MLKLTRKNLLSLVYLCLFKLQIYLHFRFIFFLDVEEQKIWLFAYGLNKSFQKMERRMELPSVQDIQQRIHEEVWFT